MTTGIRGCSNLSNSNVSFINRENPCDSRAIPSKGRIDVYAWIPQNKDTSLSVQTGRGTCKIWDSDWKIKGEWDTGQGDFVLVNDIKNTQDYLMTVDATGSIALSSVATPEPVLSE